MSRSTHAGQQRNWDQRGTLGQKLVGQWQPESRLNSPHLIDSTRGTRSPQTTANLNKADVPIYLYPVLLRQVISVRLLYYYVVGTFTCSLSFSVICQIYHFYRAVVEGVCLACCDETTG